MYLEKLIEGLEKKRNEKRNELIKQRKEVNKIIEKYEKIDNEEEKSDSGESQ